MKILYLVHQFYPEFQAGTEKFVFNVASMTQKNGHKVKVVTYNLNSINSFRYSYGDVFYDEYFYESLNVIAFRYKSNPINLHYNIDTSLGVEFAEKLLEDEKPDVIHAGHVMRGHPFLLAAKKMGIPYIITLTDFHLICPKIILAPTANTLCNGPEGGEACARFCSEIPRVFIKQRLALSTNILQNAKTLIAPTKFVADMFQKEIPEIKLTVNNHGVGQTNLHPKVKTYKNGDDINFGFIGNLAVHKGVHQLIKSFSEMNHPRARLLIYGSGKPEFVKNLQQLAGDSKVDFMGPFMAHALPDVLRKIDVFVNPALSYETYSFVNHEALSCEIPVICSKLGGMYEKIIEGNNGYTYPAGDGEALKSLLLNFVNNPEQLNEMRRFIRVETLIPTIEQETYRYNKIYNQAIQHGTG